MSGRHRTRQEPTPELLRAWRAMRAAGRLLLDGRPADGYWEARTRYFDMRAKFMSNTMTKDQMSGDQWTFEDLVKMRHDPCAVQVMYFVPPWLAEQYISEYGSLPAGVGTLDKLPPTDWHPV